MHEITTLKKQLANLSAGDALLCIVQKGAGGKSFFWGGRFWTADQAQKEWEPYLLKMCCSEVGVLHFFGGPPGATCWYEGSVLSMLCDLILFDDKTQHLSLAEKLSQ